MHVRALGVLSVFVLVAGCTSAPPAAEEPAPTDGTVRLVDPETGETRVLHAWNAAYPGEPVSTNDSNDGTFDAGQHWTGTGEAQAAAGLDPGSVHVRDISDLIPKDVPVRLGAELTAELAEGDLDLWFNIPDDEIWTSNFDTPFGGRSTVEYVIVHTSDDPIEVVVFYDEPEPAQTVDYVLDVTVRADPALLVAGVPTIVSVPRGAATLEVRFDGPGGELLLWSPDDTFLGRMDGGNGTINHTVEASGDHVLITPEGAPDATVRVFAADAPPRDGLVLRAARQEIVLAATAPVTLNQPATVTHDSPRIPIQAGLQILLDDFTVNAAGALTGPLGQIFNYAIEDDLPFVNTNHGDGYGFMMLTDIADASLAPGAYTGTFEGAPNGNGELVLWLVYVARP